MLRTGIISQARMTSSRLPGKILLTANGMTVLEHHIRRLAWSKIPIFLATTVNPSDDCIIDYSKKLSIPFYRGSEHNVLERFYKCAEQFELDVIIRVTSDCPLIDGEIIADAHRVYSAFGDKNVYYSNALTRTFPRGLDFEIFSFELLRDAFLHASTPAEKEHVTPYINRNRSGKVSIQHYTSAEDHSNLRWTLDTEDDWRMLKLILEDYNGSDLRYSDILAIVQQHPELTNINDHIKQKETKL